MAKWLFVLLLAGCGGEPFGEPIFGTTGGAAGEAGEAGGDVTAVGGSAGVDAGGGSAGVPADAGADAVSEVCTGTTPCECVGTPGYQECDGVCRQTTDGLCCGAPGGWVACCATGCGVDVAKLVGYPNYFKKHPNCVGASNCSFHGTCSLSCPAPTDADK